MIVFPAEKVYRTLPVNWKPEDDELFHHELEKSLPEASLVEIPSCEFYPNGLVRQKGALLPHSLSFQGRKPGWKDFLKTVFYKLMGKRRVFPGTKKKALVITDEFSNAYFHWVADCLPKLVCLPHLEEEYVLILPAYMKDFSFVWESLEAWPGLEVICCGKKEWLKLTSVVNISALAPTGNYRPQTMGLLRDHLKAHFCPGHAEIQPVRRVYISRSKALYRRIVNEEDLIPTLKKAGFEIFFMEDLNFGDQVRLLSETCVLVSNHGAGLTNLLFMAPGTKVLEVRLEGDQVNNCYFSLASAGDIRYYYSLAESADGNGDSHVAHIRIEKLKLEDAVSQLLDYN